MSAFAQLRDGGALKPGPGADPDFRGACPACGQRMVAPVLGTAADPVPQCESGCSTDAMLAAFTARRSGAVALGLAEELTAFYGLPSRLVAVKVYGRRKDSPAALHLEDRTVVRIDPVGDLLKPREVVAAFAPYGAEPGLRKVDELVDAYTRLYRLAEIEEADTQTAEVDEWVGRFLRAAGGLVSEWNLTDAAERYEALGFMQDGRDDPQGGGQSPIVHDTGDYGPDAPREVLIRASDIRTYVERVCGERLSPQRFKARMNEAGYQHRVMEAWRPGADRKTNPKRKVTVFVVEPERPVSPCPQSPPYDTRAHAYVRRGDTRDRGTEPAPGAST